MRVKAFLVVLSLGSIWSILMAAATDGFALLKIAYYLCFCNFLTALGVSCILVLWAIKGVAIEKKLMIFQTVKSLSWFCLFLPLSGYCCMRMYHIMTGYVEDNRYVVWFLAWVVIHSLLFFLIYIEGKMAKKKDIDSSCSEKILIVTEGFHSIWHYHLSDTKNRFISLCGQKVFPTEISLEYFKSIVGKTWTKIEDGHACQKCSKFLDEKVVTERL